MSRNTVRIIGGEWRSRLITFPAALHLRPTPDRVRETVFNWLGQDMAGKNCLDLFAGSGAMGFEAASRGADQVTMVESNRDVIEALKKSAEKLEPGRIELVEMDAPSFVASCGRRFDIIFLDPPYSFRLLPKLLPVLHSHLASGGIVYMEDRDPMNPDGGWRVWRQGRAGNVRYQLLKSEVNG
jgi:16S rRNA (guanine966-N2)-methyltransferase